MVQAHKNLGIILAREPLRLRRLPRLGRRRRLDARKARRVVRDVVVDGRLADMRCRRRAELNGGAGLGQGFYRGAGLLTHRGRAVREASE